MSNRITYWKVLLAVAAMAMAGFTATENRAAGAAVGAVDPLSHLAGRWVGNAVMTHGSGPASSFKCVVTYLPRKDGPGMRQNLRCNDGNSFRLHAATDLMVSGKEVQGRWKDKINEIDGDVVGKVTESGFEVVLRSQFFAAHMAVSGEGCDQQVKVLPVSSGMFRELSAELRKC